MVAEEEVLWQRGLERIEWEPEIRAFRVRVGGGGAGKLFFSVSND